jgi:hypothetical protein
MAIFTFYPLDRWLGGIHLEHNWTWWAEAKNLPLPGIEALISNPILIFEPPCRSFSFLF